MTPTDLPELSTAPVGPPQPAGEAFTTTVARGWKRILVWVLIALALGGAYTAFWPATYECDAVLLLPSSNDPNSLIAAVTNQQNPLLILRGILSSPATADYVAKKINMPPDKVADMINVKDSEDENQILISSRDHDKKLIMNVVSYSIEALQNIDKKVGFSVSENQERYLATAEKQRSNELNQSENELLKTVKTAKTPIDPSNPFSSSQYLVQYQALLLQQKTVQQAIDIYLRQAKNVAVASEKQIETGLPGAEMWRQKIEDLQYQLRTAEISYGPSAPQVVALQKQIAITQQGLSQEVQKYLKSLNENVDTQLVQLISQKMLLDWQVNYVKKFAEAAPDEAVDVQRQMQEIGTRAEVWKLVREQLELAKLNTQVDRVQWGVLVNPYILPKATNKHHGFNLGVAGLLGFIIGVIATINHANKKGRRIRAEAALA